MNVFFDNCTSPVFATTLHGFIKHQGHAAFHIMDVPGLPRGRDSSDVEWIELLRQSPREWIFITGDGRVLRNPAERAALRSAKLHGFVLASAYQKTPLHICAATIVQRWPDLLKVIGPVAPPTMHEIPIGKGTKLRQLPF